MWALIENGNVVEITDTDPNGRFHPSLDWRPCGADVAPGWSADGNVYTPPPPASVGDLCAHIDAAADAARSAVAGDPLRAVEYDRAAAEAREFATAGYPTDAVPRTVAAWAINGRTPQEAADSILAKAADYTEALYVIRETRLSAKEQIRVLMDTGDVAKAKLLAEQTISAIQAAVAGVGNNI